MACYAQLVADPRNLVLKKCACPSFYVVNYADLLSKAQNMHTLHFFKMHTSFLLSIENNLIEDRNTYVLKNKNTVGQQLEKMLWGCRINYLVG